MECEDPAGQSAPPPAASVPGSLPENVRAECERARWGGAHPPNVLCPDCTNADAQGHTKSEWQVRFSKPRHWMGALSRPRCPGAADSAQSSSHPVALSLVPVPSVLSLSHFPNPFFLPPSSPCLPLCPSLVSTPALWGLCSFSGFPWQVVSCGHSSGLCSSRSCFPSLSQWPSWDSEKLLFSSVISRVLSGSEKGVPLAPTCPLASVTPVASQQS